MLFLGSLKHLYGGQTLRLWLVRKSLFLEADVPEFESRQLVTHCVTLASHTTSLCPNILNKTKHFFEGKGHGQHSWWSESRN